MPNPGKIVTYIKKDGSLQHAIMLDAEQHVNFTKYNKALLHLVDEKFKPQCDANGKKYIALKQLSLLTHIGFTD